MVGVLCVAVGAVSAAPPAPYVNIIQNGDFSSGFQNWTRISALQWDIVGSSLALYSPGSGSMAQINTFTAASGDPYELNVRVGNSSSVVKSVQFRIDGVDTNAVICSFAIPANSPLQSYRMRGVAPAAWGSLRLLVIMLTNDSLPALLVDDIDLRWTPAAQHTTTICDSPPAPTPTPTPTPQLYTEYEISEGNAARVENIVTAGDYTIIILLFVLLVSFWGVFILRELRGVSK